jgi:hypothetical protein
VDFIGISLLMIAGMYGFIMYKYKKYKKEETYRVQVLDYELKKFMDHVVDHHNKNKG